MWSWARVTAVGCLLAGCSNLPTVARDGGCADATAGCDGGCVDLARDPSNCGACGHACPAATTCQEGRCAPHITQLSAAFRHVCARSDEGAVWCWGASDGGEVGDGEKALYRDRPTRVPGLVATDVYAGFDHTCARLADRTVACWGRNDAGQVAGVVDPVLAPLGVRNLAGVVDVAVGSGFGCAALDDGTVRCWGSDEWGCLGDDRAGLPQPVAVVGLDHVVQVRAGWGHVCARRDDGAVWCWGRRGLGATGDGQVVSATTVTAMAVPASAAPSSGLAAGYNHTCSLSRDGAVECWGENDRGQIGDGTSTRRWTATAAVTSGATALFGAHDTMFARMSDGTLRGWGANQSSELAFEVAMDQTAPTAVLGDLAAEVTQLVAGEQFACALLRDGSVLCWGASPYGAAGLGQTSARVTTPSRPAW